MGSVKGLSRFSIVAHKPPRRRCIEREALDVGQRHATRIVVHATVRTRKASTRILQSVARHQTYLICLMYRLQEILLRENMGRGRTHQELARTCRRLTGTAPRSCDSTRDTASLPRGITPSRPHSLVASLPRGITPSRHHSLVASLPRGITPLQPRSLAASLPRGITRSWPLYLYS